MMRRQPPRYLLTFRRELSVSNASAELREGMTEALRLAQRGRYTSMPNPRVGCVLLRDGEVVGRGWHQWTGERHAEVHALEEAGSRARGSTACVTLEPCCHEGRTAPCSDALLAAGVKRVVAAMRDPSPKVCGAGFARLREGGISVEEGLMEEQARALNPGFIKRAKQGLPWVLCKMAMSMDGRSAAASGDSKWITGPEARAEVQRLRAASCAILTGVGTVLADNPRLTVRSEEWPAGEMPPQDVRQPLRVVADSALRTPATARLLTQPGETWLAAARDGKVSGARVVALPEKGKRIDLKALLHLLAAERECNEVLLEAGPTLAGAMLQEGLVDALRIYAAPVFLGDGGQPLLRLPIADMADRMHLDIKEIRRAGEDWCIDATPV